MLLILEFSKCRKLKNFSFWIYLAILRVNLVCARRNVHFYSYFTIMIFMAILKNNKKIFFTKFPLYLILPQKLVFYCNHQEKDHFGNNNPNLWGFGKNENIEIKKRIRLFPSKYNISGDIKIKHFYFHLFRMINNNWFFAVLPISWLPGSQIRFSHFVSMKKNLNAY